jgi:general secretion pathway protein G
MDHYTKTGKNDSRGFTLVELAVVTIIVMILAAIAIPMYQNSVWRAKEVTLKTNLYRLRDAVDQYTADKKLAPTTLEDLVTQGYFRAIPIDPITESSSTWVTDIGTHPALLNSNESGIIDVHSGSIETSSDGTPYNLW